MQTALKKNEVKKYTFYFPVREDEEQTSLEIRQRVLDFIKKTFGGVTILKTEGKTTEWGNELTYILDILVEDTPDSEMRAEKLAWLILCYLDNFRTSKGQSREKTVWFTEQSLILYKLDNPDSTERLKGR